MSVPAQIIQFGPGEGPVVSAVGDVYRMLATGVQTGGAYVLSEARVPPGGGPPPHIHHREDEAFFVLEGEITFQLGGKKLVGRAGTFIQGPRGVPHAFKNESPAPARMLILVTPPGFEKFMVEIGHPLPAFDSPPLPVTPADIQRLLAVAPKYGIEILPPRIDVVRGTTAAIVAADLE
ncbi:MAG: cupin domain-containing protein [Verrucomicrobiota bacterium]|nr:cupin domain-containing protein [Limisphaerales bacterium]